MWDFLETQAAQLIIWLAVLAMLTVLAVYVVRSWRESSGDDQISVNDLLSNYREMHSRGEISDEEFRTIKTALKEKLQQELARKESTDSGNDD